MVPAGGEILPEAEYRMRFWRATHHERADGDKKIRRKTAAGKTDAGARQLARGAAHEPDSAISQASAGPACEALWQLAHSAFDADGIEPAVDFRVAGSGCGGSEDVDVRSPLAASSGIQRGAATPCADRHVRAFTALSPGRGDFRRDGDAHAAGGGLPDTPSTLATYYLGGSVRSNRTGTRHSARNTARGAGAAGRCISGSRRKRHTVRPRIRGCTRPSVSAFLHDGR